MTETTKNAGEKLSVTSTKTLTLKRGGVEQGVVRQSFSHGRSKAVVVEKVKRRGTGPGEVKPEVIAPAARGAVPIRTIVTAKSPAAAPAPGTAAPAPKPSGVVLRTLTDEERSARAHALADARLREAEERRIAEEEARIRQSREELERAERAKAEGRRGREETLRRRYGRSETGRRPPGARSRRGRSAAHRPPRYHGAAPGAGAQAGPRGRRETPRTAYRRERPFRRRGTRAFGRRFPSPRPAHGRPSRQ